MRAAQDLDAVEVEQVEDRAGQRGEVDVVDIEADARLERRIEVELADAADRGAERGAEGGALRLERHRRRLVGDLRDVGLAARLEHRGRHRGDRERRILQVLLAELRGDEDLAVVEVAGASLAGVSCAWAGIAASMASAEVHSKDNRLVMVYSSP